MPDEFDINPGEPGIGDSFTALSIAMCPGDDGTRPVDPSWPMSDIGFLSPAISFSNFPILVGQPNLAFIYIKNWGTADAIGAWLETAYNIFLGNQPDAMVPIENQTLPMVPAGGEFTAQVIWTPADTDSIHGCFHARVFDSFSLLHFPSRCMEWSSHINPQAGHRNSILIKIEQEDRPVMVMFKTKNFLPGPTKDRIMVTEFNSRTRFRNIDERFPLPFIWSPEGHTPLRPLFAPATPAPTSTPPTTTTTLLEAGPLSRGAAFLERHFSSGGRLWPRENINDRFIHGEFGFDTDMAIGLPQGAEELGRGHYFLEAGLGNARLSSLHEVKLDPGQERSVRLVIPPEQFPPRGRRKRFQVDYQMGTERPVQYFIYLSY